MVGHRRGEVVARIAAEGEKLSGDFDADRMAALILRAGVAMTGAKEASERLQ